MRIIIVVLMACLLSGCGSIISRTIPGQGHGNQSVSYTHLTLPTIRLV